MITTIQKIREWAADHRPVFRKTMERRLWELETAANKRRTCMMDRHDSELERERSRVDAIIKKSVELKWFQDEGPSDVYRLQMSFNPRAYGSGRLCQDELDMVARRFGWEVEQEIRTARFVESARENRTRHPTSFKYGGPR